MRLEKGRRYELLEALLGAAATFASTPCSPSCQGHICTEDFHHRNDRRWYHDEALPDDNDVLEGGVEATEEAEPAVGDLRRNEESRTAGRWVPCDGMADHKTCLACKTDKWLTNERTDKRTGALKSINKRDEDRRKAAGVEETVPQLTKEDVSQQSEGT